MEQKQNINKKNTLIGCGTILVLAILIVVGVSTCLGGSDSEGLDLSAKVSYDDGQFVITNNDSFDWYDVNFYLNSDYRLEAAVIEAYSTYTVGSMQFTKKDGTRFNPYTQKPLNMSIAADNQEGTRGWWHGSWD